VGGLAAMPNHFARQLRKNATEAERRLWQQLRSLKADGLHFRRQVPLAGYVADFACHRAKLVIELDGSQHAGDAAEAIDRQRTERLSRDGYRVLRFWNTDVLLELEGVVETIRRACGLADAAPASTPTPSPSPQGGGELQ
jgi:very-short-patch-repair endonuclease